MVPIERAIFIISMGKKASKTKVVERFVYSARKIGKFLGWIVVLTDAPPGRYNNMLRWAWADKVIIMEPKEEDLKTRYKISNMVYKRFKTFALEYMGRDPRLDQVQLVYYLDSDIVFGDNLIQAFNGLETTYGIGPYGGTANSTSLRRGKMWMFRGNIFSKYAQGSWPLQGGQIILDRYLSQPCLERWRRGFDQEDTKEVGKDQFLLLDITAEMDRERNLTLHQSISSNKTALQCEIVIMEQAPYIEFPSVEEIKIRSKNLREKRGYRYDYSPIVHVKNDGGTKDLRESEIRPFMKDILQFKDNQRDYLGILEKVQMDTT